MSETVPTTQHEAIEGFFSIQYILEALEKTCHDYLAKKHRRVLCVHMKVGRWRSWMRGRGPQYVFVPCVDPGCTLASLAFFQSPYGEVRVCNQRRRP